MADEEVKNDDLLDRIFGDPAIRHGLKIFETRERKKLPLLMEGDRIYATCAVSGEKGPAKPEEIIRQPTIYTLKDDLHYLLARIDIDVPIKMGSTYASKKADIVVFNELPIVLSNALNLLDVLAYWQCIVKGLIISLAVTFYLKKR